MNTDKHRWYIRFVAVLAITTLNSLGTTASDIVYEFQDLQFLRPAEEQEVVGEQQLQNRSLWRIKVPEVKGPIQPDFNFRFKSKPKYDPTYLLASVNRTPRKVLLPQANEPYSFIPLNCSKLTVNFGAYPCLSMFICG